MTHWLPLLPEYENELLNVGMGEMDSTIGCGEHQMLYCHLRG